MRRTVADFAAHVERRAALGVVVNAAAYTDVEKAEDDPERASLVNEVAAGWLAAVSLTAGLRLVHVSTDFVFDGAKTGPYNESDEPRPLNIYGASKLAGEKAVFSAYPGALVVRTSWTYGPGGTNFPLKILNLARSAMAASGRLSGDTKPGHKPTPPTLQVVTDEVGSPTYSNDLAEGLVALLSAGATGLYHLAGSGSCSRYELAVETLRLAGFEISEDLTVEPVGSETFPTKAIRPTIRVLDSHQGGRLGRKTAFLAGWSRPFHSQTLEARPPHVPRCRDSGPQRRSFSGRRGEFRHRSGRRLPRLGRGCRKRRW